MLAYVNHCELSIERVIARKKKEFRDSNAKENIDKINQELMDIKSIMHENFDMILNRDKNLSKISQMSSDLKDNSKKVGITTRQLTVCSSGKTLKSYV